VGILYGLIVALVLLISWASKSHVYQKIGLILLADWALCNLVVNALGFERAALVIPSLEALAAILVATLGYTNRNRVALVVFLLYAAIGFVWVASYVTRIQGTYTSYAVLNVLFLAQLLTVGGASAGRAISFWTDRSRQRARAHRTRWAGMG
jgi:hypothetical protein